MFGYRVVLVKKKDAPGVRGLTSLNEYSWLQKMHTSHTHAAAVVLLISPLSDLTDRLHGYSAMQPDTAVEINSGNMLRIIHQYINIPRKEIQLLPGANADSTGAQLRCC